jgi:hypothetical protein
MAFHSPLLLAFSVTSERFTAFTAMARDLIFVTSRDCDRAAQGHGFPRRYNLFDHMKRVHQYDGPTTESSLMATTEQVSRKSVSRKRMALAEESGEKHQKIARITAEQQRQQASEQICLFLRKKTVDYQHL